jgi:hypothetical protein
MADIFISYSRPHFDHSNDLQDQEINPFKIQSQDDEARLKALACRSGLAPIELLGPYWLKKAFEEDGWEVFSDNDIYAGSRWSDRLEAELESARCVICLATSEALRNAWVVREATAAYSRGRLIPFCVGDACPEIFFPKVQNVDISAWGGGKDEEQYSSILAAVEMMLGPRPAKQTDEERFLNKLVGENKNWKRELIDYIAQNPSNPSALIPAAMKLSRRATDPETKSVLEKIESWLLDEKILITTEAIDCFLDPSLELSLPSLPKSPNPCCVDIRAKSEWPSADPNPPQPKALVVQCIFVVVDKDGSAVLAIHDRSYTGALDAQSRYALVTGRLTWSDMNFQISRGRDAVCRGALNRELQEIDELNLSREDAADYSARSKYAGVFPEEQQSLLSFLYVIKLDPDELRRINRRGPYLIPVSPHEYAKLHFLGLLGRILTANTCCECNQDQAQQAIDNKLDCEKLPNKRCMIQASLQATAREVGDNVRLASVSHPLGPTNSAVLIGDIVNFRTLEEPRRRDLAVQIESCLSAWRPRAGSWLLGPKVDTSEGWLRLVLWRPSNTDAERARFALTAYFVALYLVLKFEEFDAFLGHGKSSSDYQPISLRIALHADVMAADRVDRHDIQPGLGLLVARDILQFCRPRQILASQGFLLRLVQEIGELLPSDEKLCRQPLTLQPSRCTGFNGNEFALCKSSGEGPWDEDSLHACLEGLRLPLEIAKYLGTSALSKIGLKEHGILATDIGYLTTSPTQRHRVFNIWGISDNESLAEERASYGERNPPLLRPTILARNAKSTESELRQLIDSISSARHLTIYGFSNIRLLSALLKRMDDNDFSTSIDKNLENLKIIFYDYSQAIHINEKQPSYLARMRWLDGFRLALELQEKLPKATKVMINHVRYGFNLLKAIYSSQADITLRDQLRVTLPVPGRGFELAPVFTLYRGDPTFYEYLNICERYLEQGRLQNANRITVAEYELSPTNKQVTDEESALERQLKTVALKNMHQQMPAMVEDILNEYISDLSKSGQYNTNYGDRVCAEAGKAYYGTLDFESPDWRSIARDLWCLREVVRLEVASVEKGSEASGDGYSDNAPCVGDPLTAGLVRRKSQ